jgi:hypothetical protein
LRPSLWKTEKHRIIEKRPTSVEVAAELKQQTVVSLAYSELPISQAV